LDNSKSRTDTKARSRTLSNLVKKTNSWIYAVRYPRYHHENLNRVDCVAIFPKLGLVYNRIKKSANTSIVAWLADLEGVEYVSLSSVKRAVLNPKTLSVRQAWHLGQYYSFTFVRNPYSRVLSAYLDKVATSNPLYATTPGAGQKATVEGFEAFLDYLQSGGLHANRHWWPQVDLLYKPADQFSFIGKVEKMSGDMEKVLANVLVKPVGRPDFASPHQVKTRATSANDKLDQFYSPKAREAVRKLYLSDFETFGYKTE
jgi:hypothetical protein